MKKSILFICLCAVCALAANPARVQAQQAVLSLPETILNIDRPSEVDTLLYNKMASRAQNPDMGFRILIFSQSGNNSKDAALQAKAEFDMFYPEVKSYISFEEPSFKVKVGNFVNRMEAEFFLRSIKNNPTYNYAFIVKDKLDVTDYLDL